MSIYDEYSQVISNNPLPETGDTLLKIKYDHCALEFNQLKAQYKITALKGIDEFDTIKNTLCWVNKNTLHSGSDADCEFQNALELLRLSYKTQCAVNCYQKSIILSECLLALGVDARVMNMMPMSCEDDDSHSVVEVYVRSLRKWVMIDPTYGCYCTDSDGSILNLLEIRRIIALELPFYFSDTINYNGNAVDDIDDLRKYYAKNCFFFRCKEKQAFGSHQDHNEVLEIAPVDYDVHERMTHNIEYRIKKYGAFPDFIEWLECENKMNNVYYGTKQLYEFI